MVLCSVVAVGITACNKEKAPTPDELNRNITAYTNNLDEDEKVSDSEDNKTADKENKKSAADKELDNSEGKARKSTKVEGVVGRSSTEEEKKDTKESQGTENSSSEESGKEKEEGNGLKVTDLNAVTPDMRPNAWEENLQEAMNDTSWYEVVAIQSGIPRLMMEEKEWFFNYLREQIILRGNESSMNSLHEIKNYFANLTRQGSHVSSTTQVALKRFLKNRQEQQQCSPYETITNGIRTYDGHPIPAYAKPRPSAAHIWNPVTNEWTR